jgi:peptide/nickel transport system ATP-binding protein
MAACLRATERVGALPVANVEVSSSLGDSNIPTPSAEEIRPDLTSSAASPELISLRDVTIRYHHIVAAEHVNLDIARGETVGLVGESGSGKTTLGRALLGLVPLESGQVYLDGRPIPDRLGARDQTTLRRLQMVFQSPDSTLNPKMRVRTSLERAIGKLGGRRAVAELAASVQLSATHLDQRPDALSGGLKQRVAIARAFAGQPELVVCDEPVSALDVSVQAGILELLARLQETERVAYLFISHDLAVTRYLADRIAVMYRGQLVELGPAGAVFSSPHHPYTETLLASVPTLGMRRRPLPRAQRRVEVTGADSCRFADRCPIAVPGLCDTEAPAWQDLDTGHRVRCHFGAEVLARQQPPVTWPEFVT